MTPDRAKFNKEVEKGLLDRGVTIPIRAMTEQETAEQRIKIQADQIASLKRHIGRLETQLVNELLVDDGSPLTPHGEAIAAGDGTLHGAIDYWQQQAFTMAAGQCCVEDGGLMADDYGHQFCDMERQRDELKADLAAAQAELAQSLHRDQHNAIVRQLQNEIAQERERAQRAEQKLADERAMHGLTLSRADRAEAVAEAAEKDAGRWRACLDSVGVAVSIFNVDPAGWRYPEGDHLVAAIDNIIEGNEGAWKVPIDTGGPPLRAPFELKAQSRESVEASFYRYLRDEAGGNEDNDGPMICAGLGDQFDFLRGEECDEAIRRAIDARAAIAEGKK